MSTKDIWYESMGVDERDFIFCGRLDLKHLIDLSKMKFVNNVSTSPIRVLQCCISQSYETSFC